MHSHPYTSNTYPAVQDYTSEYNLHTQARDIIIVQHYNKKQIPKTKIKIISEYIWKLNIFEIN